MYWHFTSNQAFPTYTQISDPTHSNFNGVWGSGANGSVWAVGDYGVIADLRGGAASVVGSSDLQGVWGSAPDQVWAVGSKRTILSMNGSGWATVMSAP